MRNFIGIPSYRLYDEWLIALNGFLSKTSIHA